MYVSLVHFLLPLPLDMEHGLALLPPRTHLVDYEGKAQRKWKNNKGWGSGLLPSDWVVVQEPSVSFLCCLVSGAVFT